MRTVIIATLATVTLTLTFSSPARAQAQTPSRLALSTDARLAQRLDELPSVGKALVGSLVPTIAPMIAGSGIAFGAIFFGSSRLLMTAGIVAGSGLAIGPSIGQLYVGNTLRGVLTALGRSALVAGSMFFGVMAAQPASPEERAAGEGANPSAYLAASAACALVAVGLALWDIIDAPLTARRLRREARRGLTLAPILRADRNGGRTYGLAAALRF